MFSFQTTLFRICNPKAVCKGFIIPKATLTAYYPDAMKSRLYFIVDPGFFHRVGEDPNHILLQSAGETLAGAEVFTNLRSFGFTIPSFSHLRFSAVDGRLHSLAGEDTSQGVKTSIHSDQSEW
ncbi:hypothetical protein [Siphonobacter sp. SORGH_AS_0500]|uniref:hypothetical protein n=1 Tax=Siphonobacter sp. SORGH_AS_0500 TaxID=1864824 RepID=UPI0018E3BA89|nr:hypothetical protein [Siphonobacter sp. SORGH_AS_0500]